MFVSYDSVYIFWNLFYQYHSALRLREAEL